MKKVDQSNKQSEPAVAYEPAVRNPVAIRNTVLILVALMLVGGILIFWKYREKMARDYEEVKKGRPAQSLGIVTNNFQMKGVDDEIHDFTFLEGKMTLMSVISVNFPEESQVIVDEMKLAAEKFKDEERMQFICISAEAEADVPVEKLREFAIKIGIPVEQTEQWLVLTANHEGRLGFIKDRLKLGIVGSKDKEGNLALPDLMKLVDPTMKLRGEVNDFAFNYYRSEDERVLKHIGENPELLEKEDVKEIVSGEKSLVTRKRDWMYKNINYILNLEQANVEAIKKANRSNRYELPLYIAGGFVLFIIIAGYRLKVKRAKKK